MKISIEYGTENIDWVALCEIFRLAPLGTREPEKLRKAAENSRNFHPKLTFAFQTTRFIDGTDTP